MKKIRRSEEYQQMFDQQSQVKVMSSKTMKPKTISKTKNHREAILQYLEILKLNDRGTTIFLQHHSQASLGISELVAKFLEGPASTSQESCHRLSSQTGCIPNRCDARVLRLDS
ncbi:MAG: hypothetical protein R3C53_16220 [Pirellulaceae bacterium]